MNKKEQSKSEPVAQATRLESKNNKIRLLVLWELLKNETDEASPMDTISIIRRLSQKGLIADRKTLYDDIDHLNRFGFEVMCERGRRNRYYVSDHGFDEAELRMLLDAVYAANFITPAKTDILAEKLSKLAGCSKSDRLMGVCVNYEKEKHNNEQIWYTVDSINEACTQGKKLLFKYFDYDLQGKREYRKHGEFYCVNPLGLVYNLDNYYLVAYGDKYKNPANYRVDRMECAQVSEQVCKQAEWVKDFDLSEYKESLFSMFSGKGVQVGFVAEKALLDAMFDRFGYDLKVSSKDEQHFAFRSVVQVSPVFYSWLAQFGGKLKVVTPESVIIGFKDFLSNLLCDY